MNFQFQQNKAVSKQTYNGLCLGARADLAGKGTLRWTVLRNASIHKDN